MANLDAADPSKRIEAIDALRGFALVGILFINITTMGGPIDTEQPAGAATLADPNWRTWFFGHLFVYGSMRGIFSMLFGASALLFLRDPSRPPQLFARRCFWLFCFGVLNATLFLWPGDILVIYALASPIILLMLRVSTAHLLLAAGAILLTLSVWSYLRGMGASPEPEDAALIAEALANESAARLGNYWDNFQFMWGVTVDWTLTPNFLWWIADAAAFMLIGMALFRMGVLTGGASPTIYLALTLVGFGLGLPLRVWEASQAMAHQGEFPPLANATFQFGRLAVSLGWLGAFMLLWRSQRWRFVFAPFSALGRMAFTGYLMQSVVAALLFAGFGLGLWNRLAWTELWFLALLIMAVMAMASMFWLKKFRMGPLEWAWRWLTYARQPAIAR